MTFEAYQKFTESTAIYPNRGSNVVYPTLGLAGESGEVAEKVKKFIRDDASHMSEERRQEIAKELGDVLWYVSQLAAELNFSLEEIAALNVKKLSSRKERGAVHGDGDNR